MAHQNGRLTDLTWLSQPDRPVVLLWLVLMNAMFSYVVAGLAVLLLLYDPLNQYLTAGREPRRLPRTPRPRINESMLAIDTGNETAPLNCAPDAYAVHILSKAPLVVYIENFLSLDEQEHLLEISEPLFEPSTVTNDGHTTEHNTLIRDSEVAVVPRTDTVRCIEARARSFQGWRDDLWIERLRTQRYGPSQHYTHHFDWRSGPRGWGRVSSFMAWVKADEIEGGGTEFPQLQRNGPDRPWCRWVECLKPEPEYADDGASTKRKDGEPITGVTFKAIPGNAVFWENFRPDGTGRGWNETWHAGLPVKRGTKVGLNIWSWGRL
ncbi:2OG-Fe(II) oxygenase family oxidoreductase [Xylaria bambusicola]|uniref:2OG-Fe(II) oxygenase family oxidoreductase n=1 Tax=Xylaria bambusicola TaxID=326684 RepID=UPI00200832AA|nr:2OG-Fe(II) oxygenase family oxidoreductase [Xylaria bambusicola]KAI0512668.1 2OG-Fe(II) oxygenase family oxidoreductase [Xylaria bambusicola]